MASPWHHHGTTMAPWRLIAHKEMIAMLETWEPMLKSMYEPEEKVSIGEKNPRCNGWCCFKFSFLATFLLRCSLLTAEKGFELRHSDTITVCMLNVVYVHLFIYINSYSSFLKQHFAIPKLLCCWDEHFQSTLQCGEMVKAWTFHTVIFFPPGRVAGTCRAKEQLDCSCGFGAKVSNVYEIMKWKFQVNLQLTSWKALGWVQRIIIEFLSCQLFCILGNRQLEVQKAPLMHLIQAAHEVRSTCKRCRESTRYAWRGVLPIEGIEGAVGQSCLEPGTGFQSLLRRRHNAPVPCWQSNTEAVRFHPARISWGSTCFTRSSAELWHDVAPTIFGVKETVRQAIRVQFSGHIQCSFDCFVLYSSGKVGQADVIATENTTYLNESLKLRIKSQKQKTPRETQEPKNNLEKSKKANIDCHGVLVKKPWCAFFWRAYFSGVVLVFSRFLGFGVVSFFRNFPHFIL